MGKPPEYNVGKLLDEVYHGEVVLPDFQRSFVWEPEDVRELIVSVIAGYFIGSMLVLEEVSAESPFALRLIEGVKEVNPNANIQSLVKIILDGQQRTTALFYALYEPNIPLRNRKNPYRFYIDIEKVLSGEPDDSVIAVNVQDKRKLKEIENNKNIIPCAFLREEMIGHIIERFKDNPELLKKVIEISNKFRNYPIHIVELPRRTPPEVIVETFERINRTGEPLSIFELMTARLYKDDIRLRDLLDEAKEKFVALQYVRPEYILKVIALMRGKEPKRREMLGLSAKNFEQDWWKACNALQLAFNRITDIKTGYGVLDFKKWIPYETMIVTLAALLDYLKENKKETSENYRKIDRWYWSSVFMTRYDQAVDTTSYQDYRKLKEWLESNKEPDFISTVNLSNIDLEVSKRSSAIYRGVMALIVLKGALDFKTGQPPQFEKEKVQDDHIFPKSIFNYDGIANRTLISTNAQKGNKRPSEYFGQIIHTHGKDRTIELLESHLIPADALKDLLDDNIDEFIKKRKTAILQEIGKRIMISANI